MPLRDQHRALFLHYAAQTDVQKQSHCCSTIQEARDPTLSVFANLSATAKRDAVVMVAVLIESGLEADIGAADGKRTLTDRVDLVHTRKFVDMGWEDLLMEGPRGV